jgi:hypothetical protein
VTSIAIVLPACHGTKSSRPNEGAKTVKFRLFDGELRARLCGNTCGRPAAASEVEIDESTPA